MVILQPLSQVRPISAPVNKILPFSCVDGPGSRMVIFFQGCNMACPSCHNPQTIGQCDHCLECVPACPYQALIENATHLLCQESLCQRCDTCIPACSRSASPYAQWHTVAQLVAKIEKHAILLDGITVSGGEATLHHQFLAQLFAALKQNPNCQHLNILIDSNGLLAAEHWQKLLPLIDGVMLDIKAFSNSVHKQLTGRGNHKVFASAQLLAEQQKLLEVRYLIIEGKNDQVSELVGIADFLAQLPQQFPLRLNSFRHHGVIGEALNWPITSQQATDQVQQFFIERDFKVNCSAQY